VPGRSAGATTGGELWQRIAEELRDNASTADSYIGSSRNDRVIRNSGNVRNSTDCRLLPQDRETAVSKQWPTSALSVVTFMERVPSHSENQT